MSSESHSPEPLTSRTLLALALGSAVFGLLALGCVSNDPYSQIDDSTRATPRTQDTEYGKDGGARVVGGTGPQGRLEEKFGPGSFAGLLTGTYATKDQNFFLNVPTISWYVREQDRKGHAVLGGALAYDMVTVERDEAGRAATHSSTSVGLLGIAGNLEERALDGSRAYRKHHWFFPFYRYKNVNGKRTAYALFLIPIELKDDPTPIGYDPISLANPTVGAPYDPSPVGERPLPTVAAEPKLIPAPNVRENSSTAEPVPARYDEAERDRRASADRTGSEDRSSAQARPNGLARPNAQPTGTDTPRDPSAFGKRYRVQLNDTLYSIAREHYGDGSQWTRLRAADGRVLRSPADLKPGMVLIIPE